MYSIDKKRVFWREIDDEAVLLDVKSRKFYSLDPIGAFIWKMLVGGQSEETILEEIIAQFGIKRDRAYRDLKDLIRSFEQETLIQERVSAFKGKRKKLKAVRKRPLNKCSL